MQKREILGHEFVIIKEGYFTLPHPIKVYLFTSLCTAPPTPPSEKSELPLFGCFLRGEGGCSQAICLSFCLAFVRTYLNLVPRAFSFLREKPWGRGCTYLHVLKLSVFEKIRVHLKRIQIFFAQNTQTREIPEYPLQGMRCVKE